MHGNARLTPVGRLTLVTRIESGRPVAHVAAEMGISRPTAYKWWRRWRAEGVDGLVDRSSRPRSCPHQTPPEVEAQVLELRRLLKRGPARLAPLVGLPASTIYRVLRRHGMNRIAWMDRPTGRVIRRSHTWRDALANIEHRRTRPRRPQTNRKVEGFNRTLLEEWAYVRPYTSDHERTTALDDWLHIYNHHRHHTAIGGPPITRVNNVPDQYT